MADNENITALYIQEKDRQRIARDLHDIPLQNLAHLTHKIELASMMIDRDPINAKLELAVVNRRLRDTMDEIRSIIYDIRPMSVDDLGLKASFERLLDSVNENHEYDIDAEISDVLCENNLILMNIFRVVKELLNNISKHADADKIVFRCNQENNVCFISIFDNGIGFDMESVDHVIEKHFGISFVKERIELLGGKIFIHSRVGEGVKITIEFPLI